MVKSTKYKHFDFLIMIWFTYDYMGYLMYYCLYFMIWPLFRFWGRNLSNHSLFFLENLKTSKRHSKIIWPVWADAVSWLTASKVSSSFSREPLCALWRPVFDDVALRNRHVQFDEIFQFKFLSCSRQLISSSVHRTPKFTNPEYFFCLLFEYVLFPDKSFKLISKYTQKCQLNLLY